MYWICLLSNEMIICRVKIETTNDMVAMRRKLKAFTCIPICDEKDIMFTVNFFMKEINNLCKSKTFATVFQLWSKLYIKTAILYFGYWTFFFKNREKVTKGSNRFLVKIFWINTCGVENKKFF